MVLGLKPMGKPTTYRNQVLDRTKVLHGPRTQTYGETNYLDEKLSFGRRTEFRKVGYLTKIFSYSILGLGTRES